MKRFSLTVLHLLLAYCVSAQNSYSPSGAIDKTPGRELLNRQVDCLSRFYVQSVKNSYELVSGKEYLPNYFKSTEKPILFYGRKHKSSLVINGRRYENVWLEYDTFLDELLYSDSLNLIDNKVYRICMNKDPVNGFIFYYSEDTIEFRHLSNENDPAFNLHEGFFEVVYYGKSRYIIRHKSIFLVKEGIGEYTYEPEKYVMTEGEYTRVKTRREFLHLFGERAGEIRKYMRINGIHFRNSDKHEIAGVLCYYDNLSLSAR
jgi:hypothetical protein